METYSITIYQTRQNTSALDEFEEALRYKALRYSTRDILITGAATLNDLQEALQKSMHHCALAGINSNEHFKQLYVVDSGSGIADTDWLMSKKGFCLMMMHLPLNAHTARWLWELADI